jgi:hypothetical protein
MLSISSTIFTLAQAAGPGAESPVPQLPSPPLLAANLFESPWIVIVVLLLAGFVAFFILNARAKARHGLAALAAAVLLAGAVWLTASLVTTERERLADRTRALINATANVQLSELRSMLAENAQVRLNGFLLRSSRQSILDDVDRVLAKQYPVKSVSISTPTAVVDGPNSARTQVRVSARVDNMSYDAPVGSWWRIDWRRSLSPTGEGEGEWTVAGLEMLQIDYFGDPSKLRP